MASIEQRISQFADELVEEAKKFVVENFHSISLEQYNAQILTYCVAFDKGRINGLETTGALPEGNKPPATEPGGVIGEVWEIIRDSLTSRGAYQWLWAHNRLLGDTPYNAIMAGRYDEARAAARAFIDGSYV